MRAIEKGADVATVRRIYAFQLALPRPLLHEPRLLLAGAATPRRGPPRHRDRATSSSGARGCFPLLDEIEDPGWFWDTEFMVRAERRGIPHRRDPRGLRPPVRQDLDGPRACADSVRYFGKLLRLPSAAREGRA